MKEIAVYSKGKKYITIVDDHRFSFLNKYAWSLNGGGYVVSGINLLSSNNSRPAFMHHYIAGFPFGGYDTDHINGDKLNNLDSNLSIVTHRQNMQNIKVSANRLPGVFYKPRNGVNKYESYLMVDSKMLYLGSFYTKAEAFFAYKSAVEKANDFIPAYVLEKCYKIIDSEMVHI